LLVGLLIPAGHELPDSTNDRRGCT
jgi:hypothetical protein